MSAKRLKPNQAQSFATVEAALKRCEAAARAAKKDRDEKRDDYWPLCPLDEELDVGGYIIVASEPATAASFSLKDYLAAGHEVTDDMAPFVKPAGSYRRLAIKPNDARKRLGLGLGPG